MTVGKQQPLQYSNRNRPCTVLRVVGRLRRPHSKSSSSKKIVTWYPELRTSALTFCTSQVLPCQSDRCILRIGLTKVSGCTVQTGSPLFPRFYVKYMERGRRCGLKEKTVGGIRRQSNTFIIRPTAPAFGPIILLSDNHAIQ